MKPVLFSVSYAGFWGQHRLSVEEFVRHARALGYAGVELMGKRPHLSPLDWSERKLGSLGALCEAEGIEVSCVASYTNFTAGAEYGENPHVEQQIQYVESLAAMAAKLGCDLVRVFTGYETPALSIAQQWTRVVSALQECSDRAAAHGVRIGIQNHHDVAVHSKTLLELLRDVGRPNCKLMLDPWSPALRGEELFNTAKTLAPHVVYTTLADYVCLPRAQYHPDLVNYSSRLPELARAVPMGEGEIDSATFLRGLKAGGFNGPVAYEMCSPVRGGGRKENLDRCAQQFLAWLKRSGLSKPARRGKR